MDRGSSYEGMRKKCSKGLGPNGTDDQVVPGEVIIWDSNEEYEKHKRSATVERARTKLDNEEREALGI